MLGIRKVKEIVPIVTTLSTLVSNNTNKSWVQKGSAMSADGAIVYICAGNDYIYKSVDGGLSFEPLTSIAKAIWNEVATSADGNYVAVTTIDNPPTQSGTLFVSNDGGATWTVKITSKRWVSVGVSNSGQKMIACAQSGDYVYISTDYGVTWNQNSALGSNNWTVAKVSGDGSLYVACFSSAVRTSTDGINWNSYSVPVGGVITTLALSLTGQYQIISISLGISSNSVYISTNFGQNWSLKTAGTIIGISSSGQYMTYFLSNNINIRVSSDYGTTFTALTSLGALNWSFVSMSADGTNQLIGVPNVGLYKSTDNGSTFSALPTSTTSSELSISYITKEINKVNTSASKQIK